jgi:ATP-dependent exoDNAse (exonuclease V) alpha subunit
MAARGLQGLRARRYCRALDRYLEHGVIRFTAMREQAKDQLIRDWAAHVATQPEKGSLILAHTRADVAELNQCGRSVLKQRGELGPEVKVETRREVTREDGTPAIERGERPFAPGDRVTFSVERSRPRGEERESWNRALGQH